MNPSTNPSRIEFPSPNSIPNWKWLTVSAAASAVSAVDADARTVQITLSDNLVSTSQDLLQGDITGDGELDLVLLAQNSNWTFPIVTGAFPNYVQVGTASYYRFGLNYNTTNRIASAGWSTFKHSPGPDYFSYYVSIPDEGPGERGAGPQSALGLIPISFQDDDINIGLRTDGFLEIRAFNSSRNHHTIQLLRAIFDDDETERPVGVASGDAPYPEFDTSLIQTVIYGTNEAERRKALRKIKASKKLLKKLKKKLRDAHGLKRIKIIKKIKKTKGLIKKIKVAAVGGVRG